MYKDKVQLKEFEPEKESHIDDQPVSSVTPTTSRYNSILGVGILAMILGASSMIYWQMLRTPHVPTGETTPVILPVVKQEPPKVTKPFIDPFKDISIEAKAAYVMDVSSEGVIFELNADHVLPLASITKVMTALVAEKYIDRIDRVEISQFDLEQEGISGLVRGEQWDLRDILDFTLITSSNDGASAIASAAGSLALLDAGLEIPTLPEQVQKKGVIIKNDISPSTTTAPTTATTTEIVDERVDEMVDELYNEYLSKLQYARSLPKEQFVEQMNNLSREFEFETLRFYNESGLDISWQQSGGYGSARDVAHLMKYVIENSPDLLDATAHEMRKYYSQNEVVHDASNTNTQVAHMPRIIASKTGYTDLAGGNLAVVFDSSMGTPVVVVVLGSSVDGRFEDVATLIDASMRYLAQKSEM